MQYESLILEKEGQIALVTLNRPEKLNAISKNLHLELLQMCDELQNDDAIRVVIWTGSGRGFCSGADMHIFFVNAITTNSSRINSSI